MSRRGWCAQRDGCSTDDDLVFTAATDVDAARRRLQACPDIDVVGFLRVELPRWMAHDFGPDALFEGHREPLRPWGELIDGLPVRYKIEQTYHARTPFDPEYTRYRLDIAPDQAYLGRVWRQRAAARARGEEPDMTVAPGPSTG